MTLGVERSVVTPRSTQDLITGGAIRGSSLFHSFQEFNIQPGQSVRFAQPASISHIFSRVTGNNPSNIRGTLGVLGNANLFLLNPNGILFGPNAQLDLNGSFSASTADSFRFGTAEFSALTPAPAPLLTISVPTGMQYGANSPDRLIRNTAQLRVQSNQQLSLIGGQIEQAGTILAPIGTVNLQGDRLSLTGLIDTRGANGAFGTLRLRIAGDLAIHPTAALTNAAINQALLTTGVEIRAADNLTLTGPLLSNTAAPLTLSAGKQLRLLRLQPNQDTSSFLGGNVTLDSGGDLQVSNTLTLNQLRQQALLIRAGGDLILVEAGLLNNSGNAQSNPPSLLSVVASNVFLQDGQIVASTAQRNFNGANVFVTADRDVILQNSRIITFTSDRGDAGDLSIQARRIRLDGSQKNQRSSISTTSDLLSRGNAGNLTLNATDSIELIGDSPGPFIASEFTILDLLQLVNTNTAISSSAFGAGQSGHLTINADRLLLRDGVALGIIPGVFAPRINQAANITITARDIQLQGIAGIGSLTFGATDAGNIYIQGDRLSLQDGAAISVNTFDLNPNPLLPSGNAGELLIDVKELNVLDGSIVAAGTSGRGNGGKLTINADNITVSGVSADGRLASALRTDVGDLLATSNRMMATGQGGILTINTNTLRVSDGGQIFASTTAIGDAGNLTITGDRIELSGTSATGMPSTLEAQSTGIGQAGMLTITANALSVRNQAQITAQSRQGDGGNINLVVRDVLLLRQAGQISSTAGISNNGSNGGNINIRAGFIVAPSQENSDIVANAFNGQGGKITLRTNTLLGLTPTSQLTDRSEITASSSIGINGTIAINTLTPTLSPPTQRLPVELLNPQQKISTVCNNMAASRFILSGRGGIPTDPRQQLLNPSIMQDWRHPKSTASKFMPTLPPTPLASNVLNSMAEAQTWRTTAQGKIELIGTADRPQSQTVCRDLS
ncbi:filamentous hemagglutinin N-terminal domain-containing protein [filamentous cyanobacterium LEGE 11480]|uniref:Filamentous hemagglutinin N-terminal domain-containing protein n=2 Tax=Romeriopsis TaxID=2992131 RepID=A0A928VSE7_9CYAN|nr:filamentous hemagglutinin N-terminal domain-containing protein [Romeriopsis navalis LEGE 11480]